MIADLHFKWIPIVLIATEELFLVVSLVVQGVAVPTVVERPVNVGGVDKAFPLRKPLYVDYSRLIHLDRFDVVRLLHSQLGHPNLLFLFVIQKISKAGILEVEPPELDIEPLEPQPELGHKVEVEIVDVDNLLDVHRDVDLQLVVHTLQCRIAGGVALVVNSAENQCRGQNLICHKGGGEVTCSQGMINLIRHCESLSLPAT